VIRRGCALAFISNSQASRSARVCQPDPDGVWVVQELKAAGPGYVCGALLLPDGEGRSNQGTGRSEIGRPLATSMDLFGAMRCLGEFSD
jgi:hypothetical protein